MAYLSDAPLELASLVASVSAPDRGGVATFLGVVRDHHGGRAVTGLDYTAYSEMAEAECGRIVIEAESRWPARIALGHRIGRLAVGDVAVIVAAAASHRDAAFDACRFVIEELKRRVPIWKKEYYADGQIAWVDPTAMAAGQPLPTEGARRS